jgi:hypothetical protein
MLRLTHSDELRIDSSEDFGPIPFRMGPVESCVEAKPPVDVLPDPQIEEGRWTVCERRRLGARNPIREWLMGKASMGEYLQHLARMDASLADSLKDTYSLKHVRRRLALTLFIDFSHEQGLSAGEVALLIGDAQQASSDAVSFLINAAMEEANQAA